MDGGGGPSRSVDQPGAGLRGAECGPRDMLLLPRLMPLLRIERPIPAAEGETDRPGASGAAPARAAAGSAPPNGVSRRTWCGLRRREGGWISCSKEEVRRVLAGPDPEGRWEAYDSERAENWSSAGAVGAFGVKVWRSGEDGRRAPGAGTCCGDGFNVDVREGEGFSLAD